MDSVSARVTESRRWPWLADRPQSSTQARHAALAHIGRTLGTVRVAICLPGHDAHAESGVVGALFTGLQLPALSSACGLAVAQMLQVPRICRIQTRLLPGPQSGQMAGPHAAIGSCRYALDTTHAGGPLVRPGRSQAHQARRLGAASREGRARHERFWRRLPQARAPEATNEDMKVTAKLHVPSPGFHQDITLAKSVAFLWYLHHVSAMGGTFYTDSLNVHRHWTKSPEYSTRGQLVHLRVDLETNLEAHRRDRYTSHSGGMGEEPRDNAACARKHDLFVAVAGERAC